MKGTSPLFPTDPDDDALLPDAFHGPLSDALGVPRGTRKKIAARLAEAATNDIATMAAAAMAKVVEGKDQEISALTGKLNRRQAKRNRGARERKLTAKQLEAAKVVGECKGNIAEAAKKLGKDPSTVRQSYLAAMAKLGKDAVRHCTKRLPNDRRGQANVADGDDRRNQ